MTQDTTLPPGPNQEERIMSALAHISMLLPLMGLVAPVVIWVSQKDKSAYVAFQALQAVAYQLSLILFWFLGMGCYMCSFFGTFLVISGGAAAAEGNEEVLGPLMGLTFLIPFAIMLAMFGVFIVFVLYGIIGAVMALQGRDFQYVFIGPRVKRFLDKPEVGAQSPS